MHSDTLIQERFKKLPPAIQDRITSPDTQLLIQDIGKRYGLHIDEMGKIENELIVVLLGLEMPQTLPHNLLAVSRLTEENAFKITQELNEKLFAPLREDFRLLYKRDIVEAQEEAELAEASSLDPTSLAALEHELPDSVYTGAQGQKQPKGTPATVSKAQAHIYDKAKELAATDSIEGKRLEGESHLTNESREVSSLGTVATEGEPEQPRVTNDPYREPIA